MRTIFPRRLFRSLISPKRKQAEVELQRQSRLQQLLMEISSTYINIPLDSVASAIQVSLGNLASFVMADRSYIFDYDFDQQTCTNTHEWCAAGIERKIDERQKIPLSAIQDWVEAHHRGEPLYVQNCHDAPTCRLGKIFEAQGIKSLLTIPLMNGSQCIGFIGFDWLAQSHICSDSEQRLLKVFAHMLVNVRKRKQVEAALQQTSDRLSLATRAGGIGIWDWDIVDNNLVWDDQMLSLYGIKTHQFRNVYESWREGIHPDDVSQWDTEIQMAFRGEKEFDTEFRVVWPDGSTHTIRALATVQRDDSGQPIRMIGTNWDITDQKKAEKALREVNLQLEKSIENTKALALQAEMANVAKSEFLANMSHEIRTPMNGVIGMTGLLLDTNLNEEQRRYTEIVRSSGEVLLTLINDVLDFSKIEAGKMSLENLDFDLLNLLDDFAIAMAVRAHEKGLELICTTEPGVPALLQGDPGRLRQVLTNLVSNAIKFTPEGEIVVRVTNLFESNGEVDLRFEIHDTGIGIPSDKIGLLFNKFAQVDASTTRQFGGTGLGLAISKQLAELMGGKIGVVSEEGRGSDFWFTIHLRLQPERGLNERDNRDTLNGIRVLVVDDNATSRDILKVRLVSWGMRPAEVDSGTEAVRILTAAQEKGDPFRIAILDLQMPDMDGATLGSAIKSNERLRGTHLILLSSLGDRGDARRFEKIGFSGHLIKPLRHVELFNVLTTAIAAGEPAQPGDTSLIETNPSTGEIRHEPIIFKKRILLVEDNITNQQVALGILKKLVRRADAAANGVEALKALESIHYDLVLMDVQMPEMDGLEATRRIRNPQSAVLNHEIPIIAMTAHASQGYQERCLEAGMNDYISKPIEPQMVADVIRRWLSDLPGQDSLLDPKKSDSMMNPQAENEQTLVFDKASLMRRLMNDEEVGRIILLGFLQDIPLQIKILKDYLDAGNASGVGLQAHTIKGASANIGGEALRATAFEMEKKGKSGDLAAAQECMSDLEMEFKKLKEVLEKEISHLPER